MDDAQQLAFIQRSTNLERQLASIHLPASGSLYIRHSIAEKVKHELLDSGTDPSASYCIGTSCDRSWSLEPTREFTAPEFDKGPCKHPHSEFRI